MQDYFNELEPSAVPYDEIVRAVNFMEYGSVERVMFSIAFATGCRPSELDKLAYNGKDCFLKGNWLYWRPGKNQVGWRKEFLSNNLLSELSYYRANNRVFSDFFFGVCETTVRTYFNKRIRFLLAGAWLERQINTGHWCKGYKLQFKSLRKSFCTLIFYRAFKQWGSGELAIDMTSKRLKHSRKEITVNHYIKEFGHLNIEKWGMMTPCEILALANQRHIKEYEVKIKQNNQLCLQDF